MKKKFSIIALIVFLLSGILSRTTQAKETTQDLGKKVDWIDINSKSNLVLNGAAITFQSKKKNHNLIYGLDKQIQYFSYHVKNEKEDYHFSSFMIREAKHMNSTASWVTFENNVKTQNAFGLIVFYDKNKKAIAHQEKKLKVTKKEPKPNSSIKKLSNKKNVVYSKTDKWLNIDVSNLKGKYWTVHSSLKPLNVKTALKDEVTIETKQKTNYNPRWTLPYEDQSNKKGKIYTMVIVYDKNLKPIFYINATYNNADFIK